MTSDFTSFSLFGLYFTYILGTITIAVSFALDAIQTCVHQRKKHWSYIRLEWTANEILQLQRAAYEGLGTGKWTGRNESIPTTGPGELMGDLPTSYGARAAGLTPGEDQRLDKLEKGHATITPPISISSHGTAVTEISSGEGSGRAVPSDSNGSQDIMQDDLSQGEGLSTGGEALLQKETVTHMGHDSEKSPARQDDEESQGAASDKRTGTEPK